MTAPASCICGEPADVLVSRRCPACKTTSQEKCCPAHEGSPVCCSRCLREGFPVQLEVTGTEPLEEDGPWPLTDRIASILGPSAVICQQGDGAIVTVPRSRDAATVTLQDWEQRLRKAGLNVTDHGLGLYVTEPASLEKTADEEDR